MASYRGRWNGSWGCRQLRLVHQEMWGGSVCWRRAEVSEAETLHVTKWTRLPTSGGKVGCGRHWTWFYFESKLIIYPGWRLVTNWSHFSFGVWAAIWYCKFHWLLSNNSISGLIQYCSHVAILINRFTIRNRLGIKMLAVHGFQWVWPSKVRLTKEAAGMVWAWGSAWV